MSAFFLSQLLIGIAFITDISSFQFKNRRITLCLFAVSAYLIATHYFLLDQSVAGFVIGLSATRFLVSVFTTDTRVKYIFIILITFAGIWNYTNLYDLLIILAGYLATIGAFQLNEKILRQMMMLATMCVIAFNIIIFSPAAIVLESFFLGSNLVSYWRFYLRAKPVSEVEKIESQ